MTIGDVADGRELALLGECNGRAPTFTLFIVLLGIRGESLTLKRFLATFSLSVFLSATPQRLGNVRRPVAVTTDVAVAMTDVGTLDTD